MMDFIKNNWLYVLIGLVAFALAIVIVFVLINKGKNKKQKPAPVAAQSVYLEALGGKENIKSHKSVGSRINIELVDMEKAQPEKLLEAGVDSYIKMSGKLVLVVKENAQAVSDVIFGE